MEASTLEELGVAEETGADEDTPVVLAISEELDTAWEAWFDGNIAVELMD